MKINETTGQRLRRRGATVAVFLILPLFLSAASAGQEKTEFELTAVCGVGIGGRGRGIDHATWGGSFYGGWRLPRTPFSLGARLAMTTYGSEHNVDLAGFSEAVPTGVKYSYNLLLTHLVFRYYPRMSMFTPYLEASAGLSYFFTQVYSGNNGAIVPLIVGNTILAVEANGSETLMSSLAPSLGLGGGLKVRLATIGRGGQQAGRSPLSVFLNLQGRYSYSGAARYLKPGSLALDGSRLISDPQRSPTHMFFFNLGLSVGGGLPGQIDTDR